MRSGSPDPFRSPSIVAMLCCISAPAVLRRYSCTHVLLPASPRARREDAFDAFDLTVQRLARVLAHHAAFLARITGCSNARKPVDRRRKCSTLSLTANRDAEILPRTRIDECERLLTNDSSQRH
jgi:hypothetical protein